MHVYGFRNPVLFYFAMDEAIFLFVSFIIYSIDYVLVSGIALETRNAKMNKTRIYLQRAYILME